MISIAVCSIGVPFALGFLIGKSTAPILASGIDSLTYSLFFGVGLAITAVPILGRILRELDLTSTEIGVVAISAPALNDVPVGCCLRGFQPTPRRSSPPGISVSRSAASCCWACFRCLCCVAWLRLLLRILLPRAGYRIPVGIEA